MAKDVTSNVLKIDFQDIAAALVRLSNLHEGHWGLYVEFGVTAANVSMKTSDETTETKLFPTALIPVKSMGIQIFPEPNDLTVDAAKVNPKPKEKVSPTVPPKKRKGR